MSAIVRPLTRTTCPTIQIRKHMVIVPFSYTPFFYIKSHDSDFDRAPVLRVRQAADGRGHVAYKATPGDEEVVPAEATAMSVYITFFLTTLMGGVSLPVGPLYCDIDLSQHAAVEYHAARC